MSLDKTLFKALRAGGLGHKAALLLADRTSKSYVGLIELPDDFQYLQLGLYNDAVLNWVNAPFSATELVLPATTLPLVAGGAVEVRHYRYLKGDTELMPDLAQLGLLMAKVADANGIPVAPTSFYFGGTRTGGVMARPENQTGYTVGPSAFNTAFGFKITVATAGHYVVSATSALAAP